MWKWRTETDFSACFFWKPYFFVNNTPASSNIFTGYLVYLLPFARTQLSCQGQLTCRDCSFTHTPPLAHPGAGVPTTAASGFVRPHTPLRSPHRHATSHRYAAASRSLLSLKTLEAGSSSSSEPHPGSHPLKLYFYLEFPILGVTVFHSSSFLSQSRCHPDLLLIFSAYPVGCSIPTNLGPC